MQPEPPISLSGTSASIASLTWSVAAKENQLDKVQDELHQVRPEVAWSSLARSSSLTSQRWPGVAVAAAAAATAADSKVQRRAWRSSGRTTGSRRRKALQQHMRTAGARAQAARPCPTPPRRLTPPPCVLRAQMVEAFKSLPELARVAVDPFLPVRSKAAILHAVLKDSGASDITQRLFGEQRRGRAAGGAPGTQRRPPRARQQQGVVT